MKRGFTLLELLTVISIITFLVSGLLVGLRDARQKARAARMTADFNSFAIAWRLWQADTNINFIHEDVFGNINTDAPCHDEPVLSDTDLFQNKSGSAGWKGPYMPAIPRDPWGRQYSYDNDGDIWNPPGGKWGGLNIQTQWCNSTEGTKYLQLAPLIDKIIDNNDGPDLGRFKWDNGSPVGYGILIARTLSE